MPRKTKKLVAESKRDEAVRRVVRGEKIAVVARAMRVHETTVGKWVRARREAIEAGEAPLSPILPMRATLAETPRLMLRSILDAGSSGVTSQALRDQFFGGHNGHQASALAQVVRLAWNYGLRSQDLYVQSPFGAGTRYLAGPRLGDLLRTLNMRQEEAERAELARLRAKYPEA
jgi:hypothetical protein